MMPSIVKVNGEGRIARGIKAVRGALQQARRGLTVFRDPRKGSFAAGAQLLAWFLQPSRAGRCPRRSAHHQVAIGAAATAPLRRQRDGGRAATLSNIDLQLAIISVPHQGFGVTAVDALATEWSCRRSRSPRPSRSGSRPWSARASPGRTCGFARCRPRRSSFRRARARALASARPSGSPLRRLPG